MSFIFLPVFGRVLSYDRKSTGLIIHGYKVYTEKPYCRPQAARKLHFGGTRQHFPIYLLPTGISGYSENIMKNRTADRKRKNVAFLASPQYHFPIYKAAKGYIRLFRKIYCKTVLQTSNTRKLHFDGTQQHFPMYKDAKRVYQDVLKLYCKTVLHTSNTRKLHFDVTQQHFPIYKAANEYIRTF